MAPEQLSPGATLPEQFSRSNSPGATLPEHPGDRRRSGRKEARGCALCAFPPSAAALLSLSHATASMGGLAAIRGALLLLFLGLNRGGVRAFAPPSAKTTSYARVVPSTPTLKMAPDAAGKRATAKMMTHSEVPSKSGESAAPISLSSPETWKPLAMQKPPPKRRSTSQGILDALRQSIRFSERRTPEGIKKANDGRLLMTPEAAEWVRMQKEAINLRPLVQAKPPTNALRLRAYELVISQPFEIAIVVVIPFMIDYFRDIVDDVEAGGDGSGVPIPGQLVVIGIAMSVVFLLWSPSSAARRAN